MYSLINSHINAIKKIIFSNIIHVFFENSNRYFIPEDGDDSEHPNVFQLPSQTVSNHGTLKLGEISRNFPLPGTFHFRFKKKFREAFVWV